MTGPVEQWVGRAQEQVGVVRAGRAEEPAPDSERVRRLHNRLGLKSYQIKCQQ